MPQTSPTSVNGSSGPQLSEPPRQHGVLATLRSVPGWVWVLIGGIILLTIGLLAARAALPRQEDFE